jgi:stress-induced-phosphoprotein 1
VYFSNRSAAHLKKGDPNNALEDANSCLGLNPDFSKGYCRKGAALHTLQRYNDSIAAYQQGLEKFPNDAGIIKGLAEAKKEKEQGGPRTATSSGGGGPFGPEILAQMAMDPKLRPFLNDPEIMTKLKLVQSNPQLISQFMMEPKFRDMMEIMMGGRDDQDEGGGAPSPKKQEPKKEEPPVEEDWSLLSPVERKKKETQKAATDKKNEGNEFYKAKQFDQAIEAYDAAIAIDPTNMTFLNNKAAVFFAQKKYQECIDECLAAVQVGKDNMGPFEDRAKAYTRAAKGYQKLKNLDKAIEMCQAAQLESFDKNTQRMMKTMELEKKKADVLSYQDEDKAAEAKQRGNDCFRDQKWGDAVHAYEEAVKRAPKDAPIRNNLAAALCKIMDFTGAQRNIGVALEIDPKYVKAWARKGDIEMYMKEFHKALESYKKGLELDSSNKSCEDGLRKCMEAISAGRRNMTDDEKKEQVAHAMADPEIQSILSDPVTQQILKDFGENPAAAQAAMRNPGVRVKIEKLIAAGVIETR